MCDALLSDTPRARHPRGNALQQLKPPQQQQYQVQLQQQLQAHQQHVVAHHAETSTVDRPMGVAKLDPAYLDLPIAAWGPRLR